MIQDSRLNRLATNATFGGSGVMVALIVIAVLMATVNR